MTIPDNLIPVDNPFKDIDIENFKQNVQIPELNISTIPDINKIQNPIHDTNRILEVQNEKIKELSNMLENANSELKSIHYENMKLNSQIDVLNKTIDSQNDELNRLRDINSQLKITNQSLEESSKSNKHYWRNTILVSLGVGIFSFVLGLFATEVKTLLQEILILLR